MDEIEEIKHKTDIIGFMSQYLVLKKAGSNYKALCPFHREKTPSMMISADKQIFKCFGCGESGDVIAFLMKMEGLEFPEALKILADRAGITLEHSKSKVEYKKEKDTKSRIYKINQLSAQVFYKILNESESGKKAKEYLHKRNLKDNIIKKYMIGFAPDKFILGDFLKKRGFTFNEIKQAGNPDRFRNRIIFPIMDVMGNVVGFTGRTIDKNIEPKYLNSPETTIFHKSRVLYGLDNAKGEIKLNKLAIFVEGQMDVVLSHQAGVENVIATSGTSLSAEHLQIVARYSNNIAFAFDADSAGYNAQKKAIEMSIENDLNARVIDMPEGIKDPGEAVEKDPEIWKKAASNSKPAIDWLIEKAFRDFQDQDMSGIKKKEIAKEILPIIKKVNDVIEQEHYMKVLSKKLLVSERTIREAFDRISIKKEKQEDENIPEKSLDAEENLVGHLLVFPEHIKLVAINLNFNDFCDKNLSLIYKSLQSCYTLNDCNNKLCIGKECNKFLNALKAEDLKERSSFLVLAIERRYPENIEEDVVKNEILDSAKRILEAKKDKLKDEFAKKILRAEEKGDRASLKKILEEFQNAISKK